MKAWLASAGFGNTKNLANRRVVAVIVAISVGLRNENGLWGCSLGILGIRGFGIFEFCEEAETRNGGGEVLKERQEMGLA